MSNNNGNTFLAFLTGAAVGAIVGILYAPDKGKNTRDKLSFQLDKYKNKLQQIVDDLVEGKDNPTSEAKEMGQKLTSDTIQEAEKIIGSINALQNRIEKG